MLQVTMPDQASGVGFSTLFRYAAEHEDPIAAMRRLAPLPADSQRVIDTEVTDVGVEGQSVIPALFEYNLTTDIPDWLGVMALERLRSGRVGFAQTVMHPDARGERQMPKMETESFPLPITFDDFSFPIRLLAQSRRVGRPLDTGMISQCALNVNEKLEDIALNGLGFTVNGGTLYGITNHPNNTTVPTTKPWDDPTITGAEVFADFKSMIAAAYLNKNYGPYDLFLPPSWNLALTDDFKAAGDRTILERIQQYETGNRPVRVRVAERMTAKATLVQMTKTRIELSIGTEPVPLTWSGVNGWHEFGMVLAAMIVRIFTDADGNTGIIVLEEAE